jgi:hypothetical protein
MIASHSSSPSPPINGGNDMADLNDAELNALAKAAGIDFPLNS